MRRPGNPVGGGSSDDAGGGLLPAGLGFGAGGIAGAVLWISSAFGELERFFTGRLLFAGRRMGGGLVWFFCLPGRSAGWVSFGNAGCRGRLGGHFRQVPATRVRSFLEGNGKTGGHRVSSAKIFSGFFEKSICIWGKMGYNKVDMFFAALPRRSLP